MLWNFVVDILELFWLEKCLGNFLKNWVIFSKSSGHPDSMCNVTANKMVST